MSRAASLAASLVLLAGAAIWFVGRQRAGEIEPGGGGPGASSGNPRPEAVAVGGEAPSPALAAPSHAGRASNGRRDPSPTPATVDRRPFLGRVVDGAGVGVPNARVRFGDFTVLAFGSDEVRTGPDGRFQAELPAIGARVHALVSAPGLARKGIAWLDRGAASDIPLVPGVTVRVLVVDRTTSAPVPDALVRLLSGDDANDSWQYLAAATPTAMARTDAAGHAELPAPRGKIQVFVTSSTHAQGSSAIVEAGKDGIDVRVAIAKGTRIAGRVLDDAGHPLAGAQVTVVVASIMSVSTLTDANGTYQLGPFEKGKPIYEELPAIYVDAVAEGFAHARAVPAPLDEGATARLDLRLSPAKSLVGRIEGPDGGPVGDVKLVAFIPISLKTSPEDEYIDSTNETPVEIDATGGFVVRGIASTGAPVRFWALDANGGRLGDFSAPVPPTGDPAPVVFRLHTKSLMTVEVRVVGVDGAAVAGTTIRAYDLAGFQRESDPSGVSDSNGIAHLYAPTARAVAVAAVIEGESVAIAIARAGSKGTAQAEIHLPGGVIDGIVRRLDGTPVAADVVLSGVPSIGHETYRRVHSGADGSFRFANVRDGVFDLSARSDATHDTGTHESVDPRSTRRISLWLFPFEGSEALRPSFRLIDRANDAPINPGAGAWLSLTRLEPEPGPEVTPPSDASLGSIAGREPLAPGTYRVGVHLSGWVPLTLDRVVFPRGGEPPTLRFERGAVVRGHFLDSDGLAFHRPTVTIGEHSEPIPSDGDYEVGGIRPGPVEVVFTSDESGEVRVPATLPAKGDLVVDARAPRRGFIEIGVTQLPLVSFEARVEQLETGRHFDAVMRPSEYIWVAPGLVSGRYRVTCRIDGLELGPKEVDVVAGRATRIAFKSGGEDD